VNDAVNYRDRNSSKSYIPETGRKVLCISSGSDDHNTGEHQENALRTALLCGVDGCLRRPQLDESIVWVDENLVKPAPIADLLRVHEYAYLNHLESKCKTSLERQNTQGFETHNSESNSSAIPSFYAPSGYLDIDTPLVPQSLNASRRFCGAAILAVDLLMKCTKNDSKEPSILSHAFILGRPPGHHAGPNGCVPSKHYWKRPDMTSSGFCLLNTVAVAAAYARYRYGRDALAGTDDIGKCLKNVDNLIDIVSNDNNKSDNCNDNYEDSNDTNNKEDDSGISDKAEGKTLKIAIVDIDVHHGNGTEEIMRNLRPHLTFLPLPSSWAPVSNLIYKPWLDETDPDSVLFASINLFAEDRFYPCSGGDSEEKSSSTSFTPSFHAPSILSTACPSSSFNKDKGSDTSNIINIGLTPLGPGPWDPKAKSKLTHSHRYVYVFLYIYI
jgi:acetoin utilization deacetylase AcuC-like enzyme